MDKHCHIAINPELSNFYIPRELEKDGYKIRTVVACEYQRDNKESYDLAIMYVNMGMETYKIHPEWSTDLVKVDTNNGPTVFGVLYSKNKVEKVEDKAQEFKDFINGLSPNEICDILEVIESKKKRYK